MSKSELWAVESKLEPMKNDSFTQQLPYATKEQAQNVVDAHHSFINRNFENDDLRRTHIESVRLVKWRGTRKEHIRKLNKRIKSIKLCYKFLKRHSYN